MKTKITFMLMVLSAFGYSQTPISSTIPFQGYDETQAFVGKGDYQIFLDNTNGILDKPIILVDGFDPNDTRNIPAIYALLNYGTNQNLADDLRAQGFDIVILNFPTYNRPDNTLVNGGVDYIQRNAMILVQLINQINAQKVGTEKNVVIGPSMGGLVARYGLRYMEMNNINADTRLYVSFDAPHLGANIPIGFQHLFNYMANGPLGDATIQVLVDAMIKSPASREMLLDQFEGHLQAGSNTEFDTASLLPVGKPGFRDAFQTELNTMGFPQTTRNIAIANGSGNSMMNGTPGQVVMDHTFNVTDTQRAIINLKFTPAANQTTQVSRFRGQQSVFGFWITGYESAASSKAPATTDGLDSAPGGKFDVSSLAALAGSNALLTEFFSNLEINYFDFVPTNSALGISTPNWYSPVTANSITPFAAINYPAINENHVTLNASNVAFVLNEILNPQLAVKQVDFSNSIAVKNPIGNNIEIYSAAKINNATVYITDISGKIILQKNAQEINGLYSIQADFPTGMYFLRIKNSEMEITKKLVKQ